VFAMGDTDDSAAAISFRRASALDLDAIVDLRIEFERITRDSPSADWADRRAELGRLLGRDLRSGSLAVWLAESGESAVAQAALRMRGRSEGELLNVYTRGRFRGRGVATALVELALAQARAVGLARVRLQPTEDSHRIYLKAGFADDDREMVLELRRRESTANPG
ncbi:MAG: GNAT family N-acetyltransferase, partial [Spirochaetaceae bacterium]|nr:GNAT family N-acetyltransferase [Spirochaetaceae bacterium]